MTDIDNHGHVYFIGDGTAIKIGFSENVARRLRSIQTGHHLPLKILGTIPASAIDELTVHARFAHLRLRGEWFRIDPELLAFIEETRESPPQWDRTPASVPVPVPDPAPVRETRPPRAWTDAALAAIAAARGKSFHRPYEYETHRC